MAKRKRVQAWAWIPADLRDVEAGRAESEGEQAFGLREVAPHLPSRFPRGMVRVEMEIEAFGPERETIYGPRVHTFTFEASGDKEIWWENYYQAVREEWEAVKTSVFKGTSEPASLFVQKIETEAPKRKPAVKRKPPVKRKKPPKRKYLRDHFGRFKAKRRKKRGRRARSR